MLPLLSEQRPERADRTEDSIAREKAAAKKATEFLDLILEIHQYKFYISNPQRGKYAGRIVADVFVGEGEKS